jgi:hypothetical protein
VPVVETGVRADVAAVARDDVTADDGARDILLGLAEMPSFFLSSLASTELKDVLFKWDGVVVAVAEIGFFAVDAVGRAGGLLKVVVGEARVAEVAVGFVKVDVRGATGLVKGRFGGTPVLGVVGVFAALGLAVFSAVRDGRRSAIFFLKHKIECKSTTALHYEATKRGMNNMEDFK